MKETCPLFNTQETEMEWLHLLMPLEKYKRNMILSLIYVHGKWLTETKGKKLMNNHRQKHPCKMAFGIPRNS